MSTSVTGAMTMRASRRFLTNPNKMRTLRAVMHLYDALTLFQSPDRRCFWLSETDMNDYCETSPVYTGR